jgi:lipopolysaccharide/colanic/teichoic acid biosynthesis glycosyltransferase
MFWVTKRGFDILVSIMGLPFIACIGLCLMVINPIWNAGPLFFRQRRRGRDGNVITVWKFRTMLEPTDGPSRGPADPVEVDRITPLGGWLRQTRIDELPQFLNVLAGDMSLIGPRPDCLDHALFYAGVVPGYRSRYSVRPGISGFAQVRLGYAEGFELTARKTRLDLLYIRKASWWLEIRILWRTLVVMATGYGAR